MTASQYDIPGETYARHSETNPWNEQYDRPAIHALTGEVDGRDILDVGCAAGVLTAQLVGRGARVVGVDASAVMLDVARRRCPKARFQQADLAEPLDFPDDSFDLVTASLVMHYLPEWDPTLREFRRILRPGGALVMSVHHPETWRFFQLSSYFSTQLITDHWDIGGPEPMEVQFYHRPLSAIFNALRSAQFRLDDLMEPQPPPEMEQQDPRAYAHLTASPHLLYLRAVKQPTTR
ncbi:class I SAM-dependent methyltransferase [Pseudonocardia sp. DLS-67]